MASVDGFVDGSNHHGGGGGGILDRRLLAAAAVGEGEVFPVLERFCRGSFHYLGHHFLEKSRN